METKSPLSILKKFFGYETFRSGQDELIDTLLNGGDALGIMPTGAGKSICYQIPALALEGITLIISPLISLMKDQVSSLVNMGIKAAYINSSLSAGQFAEVMRRAKDGLYKIIYVAPERLLTDSFLSFVHSVHISLLAVDEAHCVSQWGQDFRPSYLKIARFIAELPKRPPIGAFTATATQRVREDIVQLLQLNDPLVTVTGFDRQNLYFNVQKPKNKFQTLLEILSENKNKSGIVYCNTRKTVEEVCAALLQKGFAAAQYHAGLPDRERHKSQDDFIYDRKPVIVATNAFGMGIDKSNVSFVVHYNMPKNLESYYQEAGRAGRDGEPAQCTLLYSGQDVRICRFLIEQSEENSELNEEQRFSIRQKELDRLKDMTFYATTSDCLREYILRYFGEKGQNFCGNCGNCNTNFETINITEPAQKIISCIHRFSQNGYRFGRTMLTDVLRGSKNEKVKRFHFDTLPTYGIMKDDSGKKVYKIIDFLLENEYLIQSDDQYPVLLLSRQASEIIKGEKELLMKLPKEEKIIVSAVQQQFPIDEKLLSRLKTLRTQLAVREHVPAYIIFADAALRDMCQKRPQTIDAFLEVSGVGKVKAQKYGQQFIDIIKAYVSEEESL